MEVRRLLRGFMGATVVGAYFRDAGLLEALLAKGLVGTVYRDPTQLRKSRLVIGPGDRVAGPWYELTDQGTRLAQASAAAPLRRATAERKLREFMARVEQVNQSEEFAYRVNRVVLFGSYLTDAERVNDIDVAVELAPRWDGFDVGFRTRKSRDGWGLARPYERRTALPVRRCPGGEDFFFLRRGNG